jgi:ferredoxin
MSEYTINQNLPEEGQKPEAEMTRRDLLRHLSPLGKVEMDASKCTGCGLCAAECSTGALSVTTNRETFAFQLIFKYRNCLACNKCVEICPEKCLSMERSLEPSNMNSQTVFFEDTVVRCSVCGNPIGPRAMIDKLQRALAGRKYQPSLSQLCADCKVRAHLGSLRT